MAGFVFRVTMLGCGFDFERRQFRNQHIISWATSPSDVLVIGFAAKDLEVVCPSGTTWRSVGDRKEPVFSTPSLVTKIQGKVGRGIEQQERQGTSGAG